MPQVTTDWRDVIEGRAQAAVVCGDCLDVLAELPAGSIHAVVTDPPYGLSFMGKDWDKAVPGPEYWAACLRVLKPGGHMLAFAGTRTQHRMACAIEDAGFEIRDMIAWVYGSGFPKSMDVSMALEKAAGVDTGDDARWVKTPHPVTGSRKTASGNSRQVGQLQPGLRRLYGPATDAAKKWQGWGTALKPAMEPITVARKPLKGTVAANVLEYGTGALNVDGCRVEPTGEKLSGGGYGGVSEGWCRPWKSDPNLLAAQKERCKANREKASECGRWPANLIHDGGDEATAGMGVAARYFYCPKASKNERWKYLTCNCETVKLEAWVNEDQSQSKKAKSVCARCGEKIRSESHPTQKPEDLMRYLCRLVTPPGGTVLDPFVGSGSTGKAAAPEGFNFIGIEIDPKYAAIARTRIDRELSQGKLFADLPAGETK